MLRLELKQPKQRQEKSLVVPLVLLVVLLAQLKAQRLVLQFYQVLVLSLVERLVHFLVQVQPEQ